MSHLNAGVPAGSDRWDGESEGERRTDRHGGRAILTSY